MGDPKDGITQKQLQTLASLELKQKDGKITLKQSMELERLIAKRDSGEELSATAKAYLLEVFIEEAYGRKKDISSKFTEKGLYIEEDAIEAAQSHYGRFLSKNKERKYNDYFQGEADIILPDRIVDTKSKWDIWGFASENGKNRDYFWQQQVYMDLYDRNIADLFYYLGNAPEHLIVQEKRSKMYQLGLVDMEGTKEFDEMETSVEKNMVFDDIHLEKRIKVFTIEKDEEAIEKLKAKIQVAREYLETLEL